MSERIEEYSVGQLARMSGVTVRTLHHYHDIGLLKPAHVAANGYRAYGRKQVLRLQEILFYRDIGMALDEVARLLDGPDDALARLQHHRARLRRRAARQAEVLETLEATIAHLKGERDMANADLYRPFTPEKQAEYEAWLLARYGDDMAERIRTSREAVGALPDGIAGAMAELESIEADLVALFEAGQAPTAGACYAPLEAQRALMAQLWGRDCPPEALVGLADMYAAHPDFIARYERLSPRFSDWLPAAMKAHGARLSAAG
jgi:MerR family transcriptional regulator, thiopeptide resistance regulator